MTLYAWILYWILKIYMLLKILYIIVIAWYRFYTILTWVVTNETMKMSWFLILWTKSILTQQNNCLYILCLVYLLCWIFSAWLYPFAQGQEAWKLWPCELLHDYYQTLGVVAHQRYSMPVLGILVTAGLDNTLLTTAYRKPAYTDQYLYWYSHHNLPAKFHLFNTVIYRTRTVCSNPLLL